MLTGFAAVGIDTGAFMSEPRAKTSITEALLRLWVIAAPSGIYFSSGG